MKPKQFVTGNTSGRIAGHLLFAMLMLLLVALVGRLVALNVDKGPGLLARAHDQQRSVVPLPARRGLIVDARGRILAGTSLRTSVFADPRLIPDKHEAAATVGRILGLPALELGEDLVAADRKRFFVIQRGVSEEQANAIKQARLRGIGTFEEPYRSYPLGPLAGQVLGFVSRDGRGIAGLEAQCDTWHRGEAGMKTIIRDAGRRAFWLAEDGYQPPRDGYHVVLTIDAMIQATVERELQTAVSQFRAASGVAVVMDPWTGAVLAMANAPAFDPNHFEDYARGSQWRFRNRAITDPAEPGSTFKPIIAAAALEQGVTRLGEVINCEGGLWRDGKRLLHDHHPYSSLTFEEVLTKSSNIGMGKLGKRLGNKRLYETLRRFGFGERTGIDLAGESPGIVLPLESWTSYSTTSIPMGQEIGVTPLQLCRAFCVFANGGKLVQPYIVRAVLASDGSVVQDFGPPPTVKVLEPSVAGTMRRILADVVNLGTGTKAALPNYQVFGKTGTAQLAKSQGKGYQPDAYIGAFVGGAPFDDPRVVVVLAIYQPDKRAGYYGGTVAAPAVGAILAETLAYLEVPPDREGPVKVARGGVSGD
jgi:cell division protein FtsI/penicillin-binding protein 2